MARRKRSIEGRVYKINDSLVSKDNYAKPNRRVVAVNRDKNNTQIVKVQSMHNKKGNRRENLIPIEKYPDFRKESGVLPHVYTKTARGKPIKEKQLKKTNTRLNKWDMKKVKQGIK